MCRNNNSDKSTVSADEDQFLIHVYNQMFATINRIHNSIWNMVVIIGGGVGVLNLYEKCASPRFEIALIGYIVVLAWMLIRLLNFNRWCNRNLFIVSKIEEHFLVNDVKNFFGEYRAKNLDNIRNIRTSILLELIFTVEIFVFAVCWYCYYKLGDQMEIPQPCCWILGFIEVVFISFLFLLWRVWWRK